MPAAQLKPAASANSKSLGTSDAANGEISTAMPPTQRASAIARVRLSRSPRIGSAIKHAQIGML